MDARRSFRASVIGAALSLVVVGASGCVTGSRPTLAQESATTGYPEVDAVIDRVEALSSARYTARYDALLRYGDRTTAVSASQSDGDRRSLTIGDVRYVLHGSITKTCTLSTGECTNTIDPTRVSDVQMSPDFFGTSLIARLRRDAAAATGQPVASTEEIDGEQAKCVAIPVTDTTITHCVFDNGVLARLDAADLVVTLTDYSTDVDEDLYQEGGPPPTTAAPSTTTAAAAA